jgi:hypothetical protein
MACSSAGGGDRLGAAGIDAGSPFGVVAPNAVSACTAGGSALETVWALPNVAPSAIAVDARGDVYVAGSFTGTAKFGATSLVSAGESDMFVVKYAPTGTVLWAKRYGNAGQDDLTPAMAVDAAGNVFLGGTLYHTIDFGGGTMPLEPALIDAFTVKILSNGETAWGDIFTYCGGPYTVSSIAVGPDGQPIVAGIASGTITLGDMTFSGDRMPANQPFVAKLNTADGSVTWGTASRGDFDTDHVSIVVDAMGRSFVVGRTLAGAGDWGAKPADGGRPGAFRVALDPSGAPLWSQFDLGAWPSSAAIDQAGRLVVMENAIDEATVGVSDFKLSVPSTLALVLSPTDGTLLSSRVLPNTFAWATATDGRGNTLIAGQYSAAVSAPTITSNSGTSDSGVALPTGGALFVAALDGVSRPEGAQSVGGAGSTQPHAIVVTPSGRIVVAATTDSAVMTAVGAIKPGTFIALFSPNPCAIDAGPPGASTGDSSNQGSLPADGSAPLDLTLMPATCPADVAGATNGAGCPVAMGCPYDATCCSCDPNPCNGQPTTWSCAPMGAPDPQCPALPPSTGDTCAALGLQCNYCVVSGRYVADCLATGWSLKYATATCN